MMRSIPVAALAGFCLCCLLPMAQAQGIDSGLEFQVNPVAPGGGTLLLYPGGQYMRLVPALRPPSEAPAQRGGAAARTRRPAATAGLAEAPRPAPPPPRPAPAPRVASAAPAPRPQASTPPASPAPNLFNNLPTISVAPQAPPAASGAPSASVAAPASQAPAGTEGLSKQGVILFARDSAEPAEGALDSIRYLAGTLNDKMTRPQSRVELMAYGGNKGDKGSDARRLSLKRALAIRQVLIDAGVSSTRINVHAEGGVDDSGPADRVDVFVRA
jgi:outer membrane protein OmpA-like peptidoglycan-associated protein